MERLTGVRRGNPTEHALDCAAEEQDARDSVGDLGECGRKGRKHRIGSNDLEAGKPRNRSSKLSNYQLPITNHQLLMMTRSLGPILVGFFGLQSYVRYACKEW